MDWRHIGQLFEVGGSVYGATLNLAVWVKTNSGQGSYYRSQHELIGNIRAIAVKPEGNKITRMNNQTGRIEARSVYLPNRALWLDKFRREVCEFPGGRYDDKVDAFSQALSKALEPRRQTIVTAAGGCF